MQVQELWRYPIKSMLGERVDRCAVGERGLAGDRVFALLDVESGLVVSAKNPRRWPSMFTLAARYLSDGSVEITLPDGRTLLTSDPSLPSVLSEAFGRKVDVISGPPEAAEAESFEPGIIPGSDPPGTVDRFRLAQRSPAGTFFDSSPIHLITTATLRAFQAAEPSAQIDARRYRPNIVIASEEEGFIENEWLGCTLRIGEVRLSVTRPTSRCVMVTLPQSELRRDSGALRATVANAVVKDPGSPASPCAGVYAFATTPGEIVAGDAVEVE